MEKALKNKEKSYLEKIKNIFKDENTKELGIKLLCNRLVKEEVKLKDFDFVKKAVDFFEHYPEIFTVKVTARNANNTATNHSISLKKSANKTASKTAEKSAEKTAIKTPVKTATKTTEKAATKTPVKAAEKTSTKAAKKAAINASSVNEVEKVKHPLELKDEKTKEEKPELILNKPEPLEAAKIEQVKADNKADIKRCKALIEELFEGRDILNPGYAYGRLLTHGIDVKALGLGKKLFEIFTNLNADFKVVITQTNDKGLPMSFNLVKNTANNEQIKDIIQDKNKEEIKDIAQEKPKVQNAVSERLEVLNEIDEKRVTLFPRYQSEIEGIDSLYSLSDLAQAAREEYWGDNLRFLDYYLKKMFYIAVRYNDKRLLKNKHNLACFNTGLIHRELNEEIYAILSCENGFYTFCEFNYSANYIINKFGEKPKFKAPLLILSPELQSQLLYNPTIDIEWDKKHIVIERAYRMNSRIYHDSQERAFALEQALLHSKKLLERNPRMAVSYFCPNDGCVKLFLPLKFGDVFVALVVERKNGSYLGYTIFTLQEAYERARILGSVESSWLNESNIKLSQAKCL